MICPHCGNEGAIRKGKTEAGNKRYKCKNCGISFTPESRQGVKEEDQPEYVFEEEGEKAFASALLDEDVINSPKKLLEAMGIDENIWEVYKKQIGKSTAWRKDRVVQWDVENGVVSNGHVDDSGKIKTIPVYSVKLWLHRKTESIRTSMAIEDFRNEMKQFSPKYSSFPVYHRSKSGWMYEVEMPDIHIGKLTWGEESGKDGDIKIQVENAKDVMAELLGYAKMFPVSKILFPIGHDYYNVDNQYNQTAHGTPQQEDTRWRKTFRVGWKLAADLINMCAEIAEVDVPIIGGNHDEERSFYLGEVLSAMYANAKRVSIDNSAKARKYRLHGVNLLGMTHGYYENWKELKDIMAYEVPDLWAKSKYREWHTGDKHHKEDYVHKSHESGQNGVVVRILRSLTTPDTWHYNKGLIASLQASEAFLWDAKEGLKAQFTATPKSP